MDRMSMFDTKNNRELLISDLDIPEEIEVYDKNDFKIDTVLIHPSISTLNGISNIKLSLESNTFNDEITITEDGNIKSDKHGVMKNWFRLTSRDFINKYYTSDGNYIDYNLYNIIDNCSDKLVECSGHELLERENLKAIIYRIVSVQDNPLVPKSSIRQNLIKVDKILNKYDNLPNNCSLAEALELMHKDIYK